MQAAKSVAILGASGYTGAELVRLIATHPGMRIAAMTADRKAGQSMGEVFPHLRHLELPVLTTIDAVDFAGVDLTFCALPHATSQEVIAKLPRDLKIVDLSADFRLRDPAVYERWYGHPHLALDLQAEAIYGLTELYREEIRGARLVAGTGCNAATGIYAVLPLLRAGVIDPDEIIISLATGVSGAGRSPKEGSLHAESPRGSTPTTLPGTATWPSSTRSFRRRRGARWRSPSCRTSCHRTAASSPRSMSAARGRRSTRPWRRPTPGSRSWRCFPTARRPVRYRAR